MKRIFIFGSIFLLLTAVESIAQTTPVSEIIDIIKNRKSHPHYVLVAAHRGYWADYPENSQGTYEMAITLGVDIVEMDVRVTKDGQMVVFHDACLDRVTTGYGVLRNTKWEDIQKLFLIMPDGSVTTSKMLSLEQALDYLKDKAVVSIDIKETGSLFNTVFDKVVKMLKSKKMLGQSIIKGKMRLSAVQDLAMKAGATLDDFIYTPIAFSNTKDLDAYIREFVTSKKIYAFELVYKQSSDAILSYVNLLQTNGIWVGQYSFWPKLLTASLLKRIRLQIPIRSQETIISRIRIPQISWMTVAATGTGCFQKALTMLSLIAVNYLWTI